MSNKLSLLVNFVGVDKLSGSLRSIRMLGRKGTRSLNELRGEGRKLEAQLRDVRREFDGASGNVTALIDRERALERAIESTNRELAERKRLNVIEGQRRAQVARGDARMGRGREQMAQGATLLAPLILATKTASEFSSGMVDIQQKADLTNRQTERLQRNVLILAQNARQMPESIRAGLDTLLAKGMDLDAAQRAIGPAGRIATAYKVEIPDAASAAYASISNLKVPASQTARIFDMMASAGNEGAFEVRNMARHFPALTAQMQALGEKGAPAVADLSAALQVAMKTAGDEDEAGNNIKNLLAKINAPGTIRAFEKNFGVNLPAAMKKLTDEGYSSMEAIALVTKQATGGDMKKLGFAFEDMQARQGIMALIQNLEEYRRIRQAAMNSGGTVDKTFAQRAARDATVNWRAFMASASTLAITLGTTFLPVATEAMDLASGLARQISEWAQANPEAAATLTKLVAGLALFRVGLGATNFLFGGFLKSSAGFIAFFRKVDGVSRFGTMMTRFKDVATVAASGAVRAFGLMRMGAMFLAKGLLRAGLMMMANPIVLAITLLVVALAGAAYLVWRHWDTIEAAFVTVWGNIKSFFGKAPDWLKSIGTAMMRGLLMAINPMALATKLISVAKNGITAFKKYLGIKSPSRVFMALGEHTGEGLALGMDRKGPRVARAAGKLATGAAAAGALALSPTPIAARSPGTGTQPVTINATFNLTQKNGETDDEFAERIMRKLEELMKKGRRSDYEDHD